MEVKEGRVFIVIGFLIAIGIILAVGFYVGGNVAYAAFSGGVVVVILASFVALRSILAPLGRMSQVAAKVSQGDFSERFPEGGTKEVRGLGRSLNRMSLKLRTEIEKREAEQNKLSTVLTGMVEGIVLVDGDRLISLINPAARKIFDLRGDGFEGRFLVEVIRNNQVDELLRETMRTYRPFSKEISIFSPVERVLNIHSAPLKEASGASGALVVIHDVTETRRLETMRTEFVANVSHELRTPLTSIKGFIETLLDGASEDPQDSRRFLKIIASHADRLGKLIDDLLTLSKLEAKGVEMRLEAVEMGDVVRDAVSMLKPGADDRRVTIKVDLPETLRVRGDKDKLGQALINLIDNAIKFNKDGGLVIIGGGEDSKDIHIFVSDTGMGIPQKDQKRIFERFYRVDKARSRELGGTGLGLSIVKHCIELHNGRVEVESREGQGSKFTLRMPKVEIPNPKG